MKKAAPLIILAMFAIGVYFMVQGMQGVVENTSPKAQQK
jgi:ABC-type sulfate transport system permease component